MNRNINCLKMIAAAALTLGVSAAYGQGKLTANIPFEFKAGGATMPAGSYELTRIESLGGKPAMKMADSDSKHAVALLSSYSVSGKGSEAARMIFACGTSGCELAQIWTGEETGMAFTRHKKAAETERMAVVKLTPNTAVGE